MSFKIIQNSFKYTGFTENNQSLSDTGSIQGINDEVDILFSILLKKLLNHKLMQLEGLMKGYVTLFSPELIIVCFCI